MSKVEKFEIPDIKRDSPLMIRLIMLTLVGMDGVFDKMGQAYLRILCRLIDKSFEEYCMAKKYLENEIETGDKLDYRFQAIGHLENCINAMNRVAKVVNILINGMKITNKDRSEEVIKKECNIIDFVSNLTVEKVRGYSVSDIRNRLEHIEQDIYQDELKGTLCLVVSDDYREICINNKTITIIDLALMIEAYHNFVLEIISNMPNRQENGVFYYDKQT
ncbi:MAG: hypothetical protein WC178_02620 [Candidatus Paceibacterota bacterium]